MRESDIKYKNGKYFVLKDKQQSAYFVMKGGITHSESDSAYSLNEDGLSIAIARCKYLASRNN